MMKRKQEMKRTKLKEIGSVSIQNISFLSHSLFLSDQAR